VWIEPRGNWGDGSVHLVELSTHYEGLDNIVASWDPKDKPPPLQPYHFAYTLSWTRETERELSPNKVVATRVGGVTGDPRVRQFAIDFAGPRLAGLSEKDPPKPISNCSDNATLSENQVFWNPFGKTWRVMLKLNPKPDNKSPVDVRCTLMHGEQVVSETWTYLWSPTQ
jgi:periplasmic glucans biosynthesis protein